MDLFRDSASASLPETAYYLQARCSGFELLKICFLESVSMVSDASFE